MKTILLVEDDKMLGHEIEEALKKRDYSVVWVKDGNTAQGVIDLNKFDLVLLDISLPGNLNGYDVLKYSKQNEKNIHTPVVMLSNLGEVPQITTALEMGADDYIAKSFIDLEKLVELVETKYLKV